MTEETTPESPEAPDEKTNKGRRDEAQDPEREGGVGPRETTDDTEAADEGEVTETTA